MHVAYLKGWTRTVPPFHARTYTRHPPLPCSALESLPNSSQPRSIARIGGIRDSKFLFAMAGNEIIDTPLFAASIFPLLRWGDCSRWWSPGVLWKLGAGPDRPSDAVGDAVDYSSEIYARHRAIIRLEVHLTTSPYE